MTGRLVSGVTIQCLYHCLLNVEAIPMSITKFSSVDRAVRKRHSFCRDNSLDLLGIKSWQILVKCKYQVWHIIKIIAVWVQCKHVTELLHLGHLQGSIIFYC